MPLKQLPTITANALTKQTLRMLDLKGFHVWRQNNGGVYDPIKKVFRAGSSTPGISDILGFHRRTGLVIAVEIKVGRDKPSQAQLDFLAAVVKAGGIGKIVRNSDDLETLIKEL